MTPFAAIALFGSLASAQQPVAAANSTGLAGQTATVAAPAIAATSFALDIKSWPGWGGLTGTAPAVFPVDADWTKLLQLPGARTPDVSAAPWRVKVLLIPSVDVLSKNLAGNWVERRTGIYAFTRNRIDQGLALAAATLQAQTFGKVAVSFDTSEDSALYEETCPEGTCLGPAALSDYVRPRINGGAFEANDKLFHGPFHVCLVIHAGLSAASEAIVNSTPTFGIAAPIDDVSISAYALDVIKCFHKAGSFWSDRHGHKFAGGTEASPFDSPFGDQPSEAISADLDLGPVNGTSLTQALKGGPYQARPLSEPALPAVSPLSGLTRLSVVQDAAKGAVLDAKFDGAFPGGGFTLPLAGSAANTAKQANHFLVFDYSTTASETVGVAGVARGGQFLDGVALGPRRNAGLAISAPNDGSWHQVAIDLSQLQGLDSAEGLAFGFLPEAAHYPKASIEPTECKFANFALVAAPPAPDALVLLNSDGPSWTSRIATARVGLNSKPPDATAILLGLRDSDENVKYNVLDGLASIKVPGIEDKLASCLSALKPRSTEAAVRALAALDSPLGWQALQVALRVGPGTHAKAVAASVIGPKKDAASVGQISALQGSARDWHDRLLLVRALAASETPQSALFLRAFLDDSDPAVRTAAAERISPSDDAGCRRLMFVSVNDPSDLARSAACITLLQSPIAEFKREGYRGANDDSWPVRVAIIDWIAKHPTSDDRAVLRQAVISPYGQVRAAVLHALANSADAVGLDEIANTLKDEDPEVQLALIALARAKRLTLPADTVAMLQSSPQQEVSEAAKALKGS